MRISSPTFWTFAYWSVVGCLTDSFPSTWVINKARVFALVFNTCLVIRAVWIVLTLSFGN